MFASEIFIWFSLNFLRSHHTIRGSDRPSPRFVIHLFFYFPASNPWSSHSYRHSMPISFAIPFIWRGDTHIQDICIWKFLWNKNISIYSDTCRPDGIGTVFSRLDRCLQKLAEMIKFYIIACNLLKMQICFPLLGSDLEMWNPIYQPLRSGRIWHKVNFKRSLTGLNSEFSFS